MASEEVLNLRKEVRAYKPGSIGIHTKGVEFPENLKIGLFGKTGCGKTSLINSLKFAMMGELRRTRWLQVSSQEKAGGHTMIRRLVWLSDGIGVIDNRGMDNLDAATKFRELASQLDGHRGYSDTVDWTDNTGYRGIARDAIRCVVFVFSADHDLTNAVHGLPQVIDYLHKHMGTYPVIIITHVDKCQQSKLIGLRAVLKQCGTSEIFEVANLTEEKQVLDLTTQKTLLTFLDRCMTDGDSTYEFKYMLKKESAYKAKEEERKEARRRQEMESNSQREGWCSLL